MITPTPWHVEYDGPSLPIITTDREIIAHAKGDNAEANARFIVRAVNSHAQLLAACEAALALCEGNGYSVKVQEQLRAAIAAARND